MSTQSNIQTDSRLALIVISIQEIPQDDSILAYDFKISATGEKELSPFGGQLTASLTFGVKASLDMIMKMISDSGIATVTDDNNQPLS